MGPQVAVQSVSDINQGEGSKKQFNLIKVVERYQKRDSALIAN